MRPAGRGRGRSNARGVLSIVVGVTVYDEHINGGPAAGTALALLLLVMGTAVIQLARTTTRDPEPQPLRPAR